MLDLAHPLVAVVATALFGLLGWLVRDMLRNLRDDIADLSRELVRHMGNEEELRRQDKADREDRQAHTDRQFNALRAEMRDGLRSVHERIDDVLVRVAHPSNGGWQGPRRG